MSLFQKIAFRGGVHLPEEKDGTNGLPTQTCPLPGKVVIPLSQHTGAICEPLVKSGDLVKKGQKIGEGKSFITSTVHASISGKVVDISPQPHPSGNNVPAITIESDGKDEWADGIAGTGDYLYIDPEKLRAIVLNAGIVGLGGAQFPTHVKLSPPKDKKIEYVILNGAECEPFITSDHRLMVEKPSEIIEGLKIIMKALSVRKAFIGIEKNKPDAISILKSQISNLKSQNMDIEVAPLDIKYPQGAEKQLIKSIVNREIPSGGLPMDVGVVVNNVGTAHAIYNAARHGRPLIERVVTVTGSGVKEPKNLLARIGTSLDFMIQNCGGFAGEPEKVIVGGPMMGTAQHTLKVPVIKGTSAILVFSKGSARADSDYLACIRCGRCIDSCPMGITPNLYGIYYERGMVDAAHSWNLMDCIECGICSYTCPAHRPLVQFIRGLKSEIHKKKKKA
ncbi:MAG: electron transport complex subunit RsxC [Nitrospinae bacterium]|nr:electron transport complex subunit RsxC [Nitrospinota bacterium]